MRDFRAWRAPRRTGATEVIVVAVLYCATASLSLRLAFEKTNASPVWPPSGIAVVAVLLLGYRVWPGVLLVAPLLITWLTQPRLEWAPRKRIEAAVLFLSLLIGVHVGFGGWLHHGAHYPLPFVPLPWLVWSAFRFGPREAATAAAVTSGIAVWDTVNGLGPFARETVNESLLLVQAFVAVVTVTILTMAALVGERRDAQASLRKDHDTLETAVDKRTRVLWQVN